MFNMGGAELVVIAVLCILLIPPNKLPEIATTLGRFLNQLQRGFSEIKEEVTKNLRGKDESK